MRLTNQDSSPLDMYACECVCMYVSACICVCVCPVPKHRAPTYWFEPAIKSSSFFRFSLAACATCSRNLFQNIHQTEESVRCDKQKKNLLMSEIFCIQSKHEIFTID